MNSLKIKKNDTVVVLSGKDKGKQGKVLGTIPSEAKVVVEGINKVTSSPASRARRAASPSVRLLSTPARCRSFAPSAARAPVWLTSSRTARRPAPARSAALSCEKGESKKWHV